MATPGAQPAKKKYKRVSVHVKTCDTCELSSAALVDVHKMLLDRAKKGKKDPTLRVGLSDTEGGRKLVFWPPD